ncbi:ultraviolet resistance protein UvrA repressor UvrC, partial [Enterococcus faecium]
MVVRKTYDHWGIEISTWNKSNIVTFIDCDCGQLAKRELGKYNQFKCDSCNK